MSDRTGARIGARRANDLAAGRRVRQRAPASGGEPLPLLQRAVDERQTGQRQNPEVSSPPAENATATGGAGEVEREREMPTPQDVAERVYRLFMQEIRRERERQGRR